MRGLDMLGVSKLGRLYLSPNEIENLCVAYADELDPSRVNWKLFETDIEEGDKSLFLLSINIQLNLTISFSCCNTIVRQKTICDC